MAQSYPQADQWARPLPHEILLAFNNLFRSGLTIATLREAIINGRVDRLSNRIELKALKASRPDGGRVGRSLLWKLFLLPGCPLLDGNPVNATLCISELRSARRAYSDLAAARLRAPDGRAIPSSSTHEDATVSMPPQSSTDAGGWEKNNPLSLDAENPWQQWFADLELRKVIRQDVERIFPEISYFSSQTVRENLTDILFIYCVTHPEIGYRQGMHEVAGTILLVVDNDSIDYGAGIKDDELQECCARKSVSADVYAVFMSLMEGAHRWYEWREPRRRDVRGQPESWTAPIVHVCRMIQDQMLRSVDPALWAHLDSAGVEPQIYGIRWLRLLFTREFPLSTAVAIWDCLLAADPSLELAEWVCVTMLLRIRNQLLSTDDYSTILTYLLHYPSLDQDMPWLLVKQAATIHENPVPTTGVTVMLQNRDILEIAIEAKSSGFREAAPTRPGEGMRTERPPEKAPLGLTDVIAKHLMERTDAVTLNRAFLSTVTELRKGLPDLTSTLSKTFMTQPVPLGSTPGSTSEDTLRSAQFVSLYTEQERLGHAVGWAISALKDNPSSLDALRCLETVQNVLLRKVPFDASRLEPGFWTKVPSQATVPPDALFCPTNPRTSLFPNKLSGGNTAPGVVGMNSRLPRVHDARIPVDRRVQSQPVVSPMPPMPPPSHGTVMTSPQVTEIPEAANGSQNECTVEPAKGGRTEEDRQNLLDPLGVLRR
ncbi:RabGAP/TBC [Dacryopinax primogenitus]|uniref:RabGAP/TBC n=1 Tax=Dacryopinax primogenitus (strain DJM 731) TaxID=1858805 RepID=M5GEE0_DACPD|nr:RabGAP/TBC [Dacryopinax primogenitus]EJU05342.1 RabGAP/TBC [Dacryopinax primogenitus]